MFIIFFKLVSFHVAVTDAGMHDRKSSSWPPIFHSLYLVPSVGDVFKSFSNSKSGWRWRFRGFNNYRQ